MLRINSCCLRKFEQGRILNITAKDMEVFIFFHEYSGLLCILPLMVCCIILMWLYLGWAGLIGFFVIIIVLILQMLIGALYKSL